MRKFYGSLEEARGLNDFGIELEVVGHAHEENRGVAAKEQDLKKRNLKSCMSAPAESRRA